jgi:hypothetical protein
VRPGLDYLSEVDPNLIIRGEREARRVKLRDAVMDRDQRVGSFRKLAIEVREDSPNSFTSLRASSARA